MNRVRHWVPRDAIPPIPPGPEGSNGNGLVRVQRVPRCLVLAARADARFASKVSRTLEFHTAPKKQARGRSFGVSDCASSGPRETGARAEHENAEPLEKCPVRVQRIPWCLELAIRQA